MLYKKIIVIWKNLIYNAYLASLSLYAIFCFAPVQSHQLFGTRNERNSIRNIEVNVPSREVSKATVCTSRHRRGGRREDRGREKGKCAAKVEDALQWVPRQRARSVWLSALPWAANKVLTCGSHLPPDERHGYDFKMRLVIEKDPNRSALPCAYSS